MGNLRLLFSLGLSFVLTSMLSATSFAQGLDPKDIKKMAERIVGHKLAADDAALAQIVSTAQSSGLEAAATLATQQKGFYNLTVKLMGLKMSGRSESTREPFNDFAASLVGAVRDNLHGKLLLQGNFHYRGAAGLPGVAAYRGCIKNPLGVAGDNCLGEDHYQNMGSIHSDLSLPAVLQRVDSQVIKNSDINPDFAGLLTTRQFLAEHLQAGTNRRAVEYAFREFMCLPIEEWSDITAPDDRVARDISRTPGGDPSRYMTSCRGCHSQMDGFRGAFAKTEFADFTTNRVIITPTTEGSPDFTNANGIPYLKGGLAIKMNHNEASYPQGYVTQNDSWTNRATGMYNAKIMGWRGAYQKGTGVKDFGRVLSDSRRFSQCMVKRAYEATCRRTVKIGSENPWIDELADKFEAGNEYSLRKLFVNVAVREECYK